MWGDRSLGNLQGVDQRLMQVMQRAREISGVPFEVSEGRRNKDRQRQLVAEGKSQTMNSRHLHGNAVDVFIPKGDGGVNWDFESYRPIADAAKQAAQELGYNDFVWGGDWKTLKDGVHFQIGSANRTPQTATTGTQGAASMMQQEQKPRGLLGSLGIQKMEEGAEGETGQRFYNRDSFKDTAAILAQGFGRMGVMGMEEIADSVAKQRTEKKARNKTIEMLGKMPNGEELVKLAEIMGPAAVAQQVLAQRFAKPKDVEYETKILKLADGSDVMVERLKGTNDPWQPSQIPAGGTTGSGAPVKELTEGQSKLTLFQTLQTETQPVLLALENQFDPANLKDPTMSRLPIAGNYFKSPEYQMYETAAAAWAEGALRIATGAAAQQSEIERNIKTYFAQPGDTPQTVAFKARMRDMYSRAVNNSLGQAPTGESLPIPTPADFAEQLEVGSLTQGSTAVGEINSILGAN